MNDWALDFSDEAEPDQRSIKSSTTTLTEGREYGDQLADDKKSRWWMPGRHPTSTTPFVDRQSASIAREGDPPARPPSVTPAPVVPHQKPKTKN